MRRVAAVGCLRSVLVQSLHYTECCSVHSVFSKLPPTWRLGPTNRAIDWIHVYDIQPEDRKGLFIVFTLLFGDIHVLARNSERVRGKNQPNYPHQAGY